MQSLKMRIRRSAEIMKKYGGKIAYYGAVTIALSAIAIAAEQYRTDRDEAADALILPAVDVEAAAPAEKKTSFQLPEDMISIRGFTREPRWNQDLGQWENHMAVDYRCPDNVVVSACDGVVSMIGESGVCGGFVEITAGEYLLRYASMEPEQKLEPGMKVSAGDVIGTADASMASEALMGAHLHLELIKMGESIDFAMEAEKNTAQSD